MMRSSSIAARVPRAARLFALVSVLLLSGLAARADTIYTLHATSQSGQVFNGTFTIPTIPIPLPDPERFILFTGQITQTSASGQVLDTYVPDESDVEGSVRRFLWHGTHQNGRMNDVLYMYVEGSAFGSQLTACTTTHVCDCTPVALCPSPGPDNVITIASYCNMENYREPCDQSDEQDFRESTITGVSTAATPEPPSLLLSLTGALCLVVVWRKKVWPVT